MIQKNKEKLEQKARRKPPIPYTKIGTSKKDIVDKINKKIKYNHYENY